MNRRRAIGFTAILLATATVAGLWFVNTEALDFPYRDQPLRLAAGETAEVEIDSPCLPLHRTVYRRSFFGRWQETHFDGQPDLRRWWEVGRRTVATPAVCNLGPPMVVQVPDDVTADHIAVCGEGTSHCVEVLVEQAD